MSRSFIMIRYRYMKWRVIRMSMFRYERDMKGLLCVYKDNGIMNNVNRNIIYIILDIDYHVNWKAIWNSSARHCRCIGEDSENCKRRMVSAPLGREAKKIQFRGAG